MNFEHSSGGQTQIYIILMLVMFEYVTLHLFGNMLTIASLSNANSSSVLLMFFFFFPAPSYLKNVNKQNTGILLDMFIAE